jgi:hypothetical protein
MKVVKIYEAISIKPSCLEEETTMTIRLETKDQAHPIIDLKIRKQALRFIVDQITNRE